MLETSIKLQQEFIVLLIVIFVYLFSLITYKILYQQQIKKKMHVNGQGKKLLEFRHFFIMMTSIFVMFIILFGTFNLVSDRRATENYKIPLDNNQINFNSEELLEDIKSKLKPDDNNLYAANIGVMVSTNLDGSYKRFFIDFLIIRDNKVIQYQTNYDALDEELEIMRSWEVGITPSEVVNTPTIDEWLQAFERLDIDHLNSIASEDVLYYSINSYSLKNTGNLQVELVNGSRSFEIKKDGSVQEFTENTEISGSKYTDILVFMMKKMNNQDAYTTDLTVHYYIEKE